MAQLGRFIRLRWVAALTVLLGALAEGKQLHWYPPGAAVRIAQIGVGILIYNAAFWLILREFARHGRRALTLFAMGQLCADLFALTILTLQTGGSNSPVRGFFVLHMVFASLLLSQEMALGSAGIALLMMVIGLRLTHQWPSSLSRESGAFLGWAGTVILTTWLANGMVRDLRRQRQRLLSRNRRIRAMSRKLRRQQQAMIQHEKMASAGQMAAGVAHEIANPLASMDSLLQLAQRRPEKLRPEMIITLREQITRISQIVRRMTTFAHPGDGQWQAATLNDVVEKAWEVIRFDPRLKDVAVDRELSPTMPQARMMPDALQQVIINLIVNALDAMESTPDPRLKLSTAHHNGYCTLEVADNGPGIEEKHLKRIFEPFFTTKPVGKGTGLGLSISYSLIKRHNGEIAVHSAPGQGAAFTIKLPTDLKD